MSFKQIVLLLCALNLVICGKFVMAGLSYSSDESMLESSHESLIYKTMVIVEGDILIHKYCECVREQDCHSSKGRIIGLKR